MDLVERVVQVHFTGRGKGKGKRTRRFDTVLLVRRLDEAPTLDTHPCTPGRESTWGSNQITKNDNDRT